MYRSLFIFFRSLSSGTVRADQLHTSIGTTPGNRGRDNRDDGAQKERRVSATAEQTKQRSEETTGVSNVAYDLMVVLTNKLQGIAALESYKNDAVRGNDPKVSEIFARLIQRDRQEIDELRGLLIERLG